MTSPGHQKVNGRVGDFEYTSWNQTLRSGFGKIPVPLGLWLVLYSLFQVLIYPG